MNEIKKDNKGYLYPNSNKSKPTQPDFTGKVTINNKEWRLSAWENVSPDGKKYLNINVSLPLEPAAGQPGTPNQQNNKTGNANSSPRPEISKTEMDDLEAILKLTDDDNPFN